MGLLYIYFKVMDARNQKKLNRKLKLELDIIIREISRWAEYIQRYCYHLKFYTHSTHAVYRLLQKLLEICGDEGLSKRCEYHNLIYGPRSIAENRKILKYLLNYIDLQVNWIGATINLNGHIGVQKGVHFCIYACH